jgi:hypothetical protein
MSFRIRGLDPAPFLPLYGLDDAALAALGVARVDRVRPACHGPTVTPTLPQQPV